MNAYPCGTQSALGGTDILVCGGADIPVCRLSRRRRHGVTAVMAMMYLVLLSTMAVGFYEATSTSLRIANNDQYTAAAQQAAESGMQFIRYQLAQLDVPHGT